MILSRYRFSPLPAVTDRYGPLPSVTNVTNVTERYQRYQRYQRYIYFLTTEYKIPSNKVYSKSFIFDQLPLPLPNFGIVFKGLCYFFSPFIKLI